MGNLTLTHCLALSLLLTMPADAADRYVCQVDTKRMCSETGCEEMEILEDDYRIIDKQSRSYTIGTDNFPLEDAKVAGAFEFFKVGGAGFMKMILIDEPMTGLKRGQFIEVRDTFLSVVTSYGVCRF